MIIPAAPNLCVFVILELGNDLVGLPLRPYEVVLVPFLEVTQGPPETLFQAVSHEYRVVTSPYVVLVRGEGLLWEGDQSIIRLVDLHQELSVVLLFELKILILIFRVRQVFCQLLNLHGHPI